MLDKLKDGIRFRIVRWLIGLAVRVDEDFAVMCSLGLLVAHSEEMPEAPDNLITGIDFANHTRTTLH